jgi:hypothetical protein
MVRMTFCALPEKVVGLLEMACLQGRIDVGTLIVRFCLRIPVLTSTETLIFGQVGLGIGVLFRQLEMIDIMIVTETVTETEIATGENGKGNDDRTTDSEIIG